MQAQDFDVIQNPEHFDRRFFVRVVSVEFVSRHENAQLQLLNAIRRFLAPVSNRDVPMMALLDLDGYCRWDVWVSQALCQ